MEPTLGSPLGSSWGGRPEGLPSNHRSMAGLPTVPSFLLEQAHACIVRVRRLLENNERQPSAQNNFPVSKNGILPYSNISRYRNSKISHPLVLCSFMTGRRENYY